MDRAPSDVIPLESRRRRAPAPRRLSLAPAPVPARRGSWALAAGALLLVVAFLAGRQHARLRDVRALDTSQRTRIFARSFDDLKTACRSVDLGDGALRDHCREQAAFLILFPECDARCQTLAAAVLPHARR